MSTITTAPDSSPRRNSHWSVSIVGGLGFLLFSVVAVLFHDSIRSMPLFGESVVLSVLNTILLALMSLAGALVTLTLPLIIFTDAIASLVLLWNTRKYPQLAKMLRQHELEHGPTPAVRWADRFASVCLLASGLIMLVPLVRLLS